MGLLNSTYNNDSLHDKFVKSVRINYTVYTPTESGPWRAAKKQKQSDSGDVRYKALMKIRNDQKRKPTSRTK
jgi:hypothetical protein